MIPEIGQVFYDSDRQLVGIRVSPQAIDQKGASYTERDLCVNWISGPNIPEYLYRDRHPSFDYCYGVMAGKDNSIEILEVSSSSGDAERRGAG